MTQQTKLQTLLSNKITKTIFTIAAGIIYPLAFAPYGLYPLAIVSLAILFYCLKNSSPKRAATFGFLFGLAAFGIGCNWLYISIHDVGGAPVVMGVLLTLFFAAVLAVFPLIFAYIMQRCCKNETYSKWILIAPAVWTILDLIRSHIFTGFAWLMIGYSQTAHLLAASASIIGLYGITWLCALIAAAISELITCRNYKTAVSSVAIVLIILCTSLSATFANWTKPSAKVITASLIQGNITQKIKWNPEELQNNIDVYVRMTEQAINSNLIIWPESAIPVFSYQLQNILQPLSEQAKQNKTTILAGLPYLDRETSKYYNSLLVLGADSGRYFKIHLVPFGEYFPFPWLTKKILAKLNIPMSKFSAGNNNQPLLHVQGTNIAPFICYEITYPDQVLKRSLNSNLLLTITDDGWFGDSIAPAQHVQMAAFQAESLQRPLMFASNNGVTAVINKYGVITRRLDFDQRQTLKANIKPVTGRTPLQRFGYLPLWLTIFACLLIGLYLQYRNNKQRPRK